MFVKSQEECHFVCGVYATKRVAPLLHANCGLVMGSCLSVGFMSPYLSFYVPTVIIYYSIIYDSCNYLKQWLLYSDAHYSSIFVDFYHFNNSFRARIKNYSVTFAIIALACYATKQSVCDQSWCGVWYLHHFLH